MLGNATPLEGKQARPEACFAATGTLSTGLTWATLFSPRKRSVQRSEAVCGTGMGLALNSVSDLEE